MYLNKIETVTLAQVLALYADSRASAGTSDFQRATDALRRRAEEDLSGVHPEHELEEGDLYDKEETFHAEDEDDSCETEGAPSEEDEAECTFPGEGAEPAEEDGIRTPAVVVDPVDDIVADRELPRRRFTSLPKLITNAGVGRFKVVYGTLQFQLNCEELNGEELVVGDVMYAKRFAKTLYLRDGWEEWHVFNVAKFPNGWVKTLPVHKLVEVTE